MTLQLNSNGPAVKELQNLLNKNGASLVEDGNFGPATKKAVIEFQSKSGLLADGIAGPKTMALLKGEQPQAAPILFVGTMSRDQKAVAVMIVTELEKHGVTNQFMQAAILSVVSKETGFTPVIEKGYSNTDNDRIRKIFGGRVSHLSDAELNAIKSNNQDFFNLVYGGEWGRKNLGNTQPNDGWLFVGRGLNGLTGRANYEVYNKYTKENIVTFPAMLENLDVAIEILVGYFIDQISHGGRTMLMNYHMTSINDAKTLEDAIGAAYHANAGWGMSMSAILNDSTGGWKKAFDRGPEFLAITYFLQ